MITIYKADEDTHGPNIYSVIQGSQLVCRFEHEKWNGLVDCLQKAADAVELTEWAEYVMMDDSKGG